MLPCVMDALKKFHSHGFSVYALVCDGVSSNLTMIKTLLGKKVISLLVNPYLIHIKLKHTSHQPIFWRKPAHYNLPFPLGVLH